MKVSAPNILEDSSVKTQLITRAITSLLKKFRENHSKKHLSASNDTVMEALGVVAVSQNFKRTWMIWNKLRLEYINLSMNLNG